MEIILTSRQIITGELRSDDPVKVESAHIMINGMEFKKLDVVDNKFEFEITEQFENGSYDIVFNIIINGKESTVKNSFIVSNGKIDPSLPLDMQSLA